jgi:large subunit ribosomal protein L25
VPDIVLVADTTRPTGSANARRLRHHGHIPAVVYGHGVESTAIAVESRALRTALSTAAGQNVVLDLEINGTRHMAMAKVVDHHPVRHTISHVDFLVINRDEKVTTDVPVSLIGEALEVTREGGVVEQMLHTITLTMLPSNIPDVIEADVSELQIGGTIRVSDLTLPAGVETDVDPETPVVMAAQASALEEPEPEVAEEGGEEAGEGAAPVAESAPEAAE